MLKPLDSEWQSWSATAQQTIMIWQSWSATKQQTIMIPNKKKIENNSYRKGSLGVLPQHKFEKLKIIQFQFNTVKATSGQKGMVHKI